MKIINNKNFKIKDYEAALGYLYDLLENKEVQKSEDFIIDCLDDIDEIYNILENNYSYDLCKKRTKQNRKKIEYRKKRKLYRETGHSYNPAVIVHEDGSLRYNYWGNNAKKHFKKVSNRKVRHTSNRTLKSLGTLDIGKGNTYRKIFDYWWTIT